MDPLSAAIGIGLIVSLVFSELFGLAAGGMVVPGYVALYLNDPAAIASTLLVALASFGAVRLASRLFIIYGRRRTVSMIVIAFFLGMLLRAAPLEAAAVSNTLAPGGLPLGQVVGFIIPGLIAIWFDRQGIIETSSVLITTAVLVRLVLILCGMEALA